MSHEWKAGGIAERISIAGADLIEYAKDLIEQGSVRRLVIRKPAGGQLLDIPLSAGIAVSAVLILIAPVLAALAAVAALVAKIQVEIVRRDDED